MKSCCLPALCMSVCVQYRPCVCERECERVCVRLRRCAPCLINKGASLSSKLRLVAETERDRCKSRGLPKGSVASRTHSVRIQQLSHSPLPAPHSLFSLSLFLALSLCLYLPLFFRRSCLKNRSATAQLTDCWRARCRAVEAWRIALQLISNY